MRTAFAAGLAAVVMMFSWLTTASCQDQVNVAMASGGYLYISVMTADALGYFRAENIDANIYDAGSGTKAMSQLAAGQAQFGLTAPPSGFLARQRGIDGQVGSARFENSEQRDDQVRGALLAHCHQRFGPDAPLRE